MEGGGVMKYRIRCGERYYYGIAWRNGKSFQNWDKESCFVNPLEMNLNDAECTLATLLKAGNFTEMPVIERVEE